MPPTRTIVALAAAAVLGACAADGSESNEEPNARRVILVTGATGTQGGAVARELLDRGYRVRALTRSPTKPAAVALADLGMEVVQGDFEDVQSLIAAMEGASGVFAMTDFWEHGYDREVRHGRNLVEAAVAAGVGHLVYSSVGSADRDTGIPHFDSKYEVEGYLRASGLAYSILRPVAFMENWDGQKARIRAGGIQDPRDPSSSSQSVSVRDIGFFAANAFDSPEDWQGRELDIAGDALTGVELAAAFSRVLGQTVEYVQISWDDFEAAAGAESTEMMRWFEEVGYDADIPGLRAEHPGLLTLEEYLREAGWAEAEGGS